MRLLVKWERQILSNVTLIPQYMQKGDFSFEATENTQIGEIRHLVLVEMSKTILTEKEVPGLVKISIQL